MNQLRLICGKKDIIANTAEQTKKGSAKIKPGSIPLDSALSLTKRLTLATIQADEIVRRAAFLASEYLRKSITLWRLVERIFSNASACSDFVMALMRSPLSMRLPALKTV